MSFSMLPPDRTIRHPATTKRRGRWLAICVSMLAAITVPVRTQSGSPGLTIEDAVAAALRDSPDVRLARGAVDLQRGIHVQAARPFDARPAVAVGTSRTVLSGSEDLTETAPSYSALGTRLQAGISKMFRSGLTLESDVATTRTAPALLEGPTVNQITATADLTIPLRQGKGGGLPQATERAARLELDASERDLRRAAAAAVLRATLAYWEYRAAYERSTIVQAAADRSRKSVEEVTILIAADERPRSDIDLMLANAATKRAAEIDAAGQIVHARTLVAEAIGADLESAAIGTPASGLPDPTLTGPLVLDQLVRDALAQHDDLAAARSRQERAQVLRSGTANQLTPRFDLVLHTGFTGHVSSANLAELLGAAFKNVRGPNLSIQFVFEPSAVNSAVRGAMIEADAVYEQAAVTSDAVVRTVRYDIADALAGVESSRAQLASVREAVIRSRRALETVQRNFELGTATVFDRILAEDAATNAELAVLSATLRYATALATLQFARGVLIDGQGSALTVDPARVVRARQEDGR